MTLKSLDLELAFSPKSIVTNGEEGETPPSLRGPEVVLLSVSG